MTATSKLGAPVQPSRTDRLALRPIVDGHLSLDGGLWGDRQQRNRAVTIPHGIAQLRRTGSVTDLELAADGRRDGYVLPLFRDSDLYKVLEALSWERRHGPDPEQEAFLAEMTGLLARAQEPDGYLNSYIQVCKPGGRFSNPAADHELYCAGHLFQAAIADTRTGGDGQLLAVARRFADYLADVLGTTQRHLVDGHPEVEMALIELGRTTGGSTYLGTAVSLLERRGHRTLSPSPAGAAYYQDDVSLAEATTVRGHAVRALYLAAGAVDGFVETGRQDWLDAQLAQWEDMVGAKTYLTGGVGARHEGEAFGEPFELPADRAYCETCAAIASVFWSWRLLLVTGEARFAELIERTLHNGVASGIGLDGRSFFYVNPLQVRAPGPTRQAWYDCACCPPNLMRLLATIEHYVATTSAGGFQLHQYTPGQFYAEVAAAGRFGVRVETDYPWQGEVLVRVEEAPDRPVELSLRLPSWASGCELALNGRACTPDPDRRGYLRFTRAWHAGDEVRVELPLRPRLTTADPRIDAVRGTVAIERGPLVYCVEGVDQRAARIGQVAVPVAGRLVEGRAAVAGTEVVTLDVEAVASEAVTPVGQLPYGPLCERGELAVSAPAVTSGSAVTSPQAGTPTTLRAIPYFAWANRGPSDMRVWLPRQG